MNSANNTYNIIAKKDLDFLCDCSSDSIFLALSRISLISRLYASCKIRIAPPFSTNFRDALFHYKKLYEADTLEEAISQKEAINEHLSRSIKDSLIQLTQVLLFSINSIYEDPNILSNKKLLIQEGMHIIKQAVLKLRIDSMDIVRISNDNLAIMDDICEAIRLLSKDEEIKYYLLERCSQYVKQVSVYFNK